MNRRIVLACVAGALAVAGLLLLAAGPAGATASALAPQPQASPLRPPTAVPTTTPALRIVGPEGEALSSPLIHRVPALATDWQYTLYVQSLLTAPVTIHARLQGLTGDEAVPATLRLSPGVTTVMTGATGAFSLSLFEGVLPEGRYTGTVAFVAENVQTVTEQFVLVVTPWTAQLAWEQDDFVAVVDRRHTEATVRFSVRTTGTAGLDAELSTLRRRDGTTTTVGTVDFLEVTAPARLARGETGEVTLRFEPGELPEPGTYEGTLRLSASNAAPLAATVTVVIPARDYELRIAGLSGTPTISPSVESTSTFSRALQFNGVRWLPGSTRVADWWPQAAGALLLGLGLAALVAYALWAWGLKLDRNWGWVLLALAVGIGAVMILSTSLGLDPADPARVGERDLLIWEAQGRGPVRDIRVVEGEVSNGVGDTGQTYAVSPDTPRLDAGEVMTVRVGDTGQTYAVSPDTLELDAGEVLTVRIGVRGLSRPGIYEGHVLIRSPEIAGGTEEVPIQVTVRDSILWPIVVIALGVIVGGYVKYQQDVAGKRLEKRTDVEKAWQRWDDYKPVDPFVFTPEKKEKVNPIYDRVRCELDDAATLLDQAGEWGIEDAGQIVEKVDGWHTTYQRLGRTLVHLRKDPEREAFENARDALLGGDMEDADNLIKITMEYYIETLLEKVKEELSKVAGDAQKAKPLQHLQELLNGAKGLLEQSKFEEAWLKFKAAKRGFDEATAVVTAAARVVLAIDSEVYAREAGYAIQLPAGPTQPRAGDHVRLAVVAVRTDLPAGTTFKWRADPPEGVDASAVSFRPDDERTTFVEFRQPGRWTVKVEVKLPDQSEARTPSLDLAVRPSGLEMVYRERRRQSACRRLAALLLAVVAGIGAKQVFGLTFGSIEQYLGAFAWGVAAGSGVEPTVDAYKTLRDAVKNLLGKLAPSGGTGTGTETPSQQPPAKEPDVGIEITVRNQES
jgi:hypothetical protein